MFLFIWQFPISNWTTRIDGIRRSRRESAVVRENVSFFFIFKIWIRWGCEVTEIQSNDHQSVWVFPRVTALFYEPHPTTCFVIFHVFSERGSRALRFKNPSILRRRGGHGRKWTSHRVCALKPRETLSFGKNKLLKPASFLFRPVGMRKECPAEVKWTGRTSAGSARIFMPSPPFLPPFIFPSGRRRSSEMQRNAPFDPYRPFASHKRNTKPQKEFLSVFPLAH